MKLLYSISTLFISACAVSGVMIHGAHLDQIASVSSPSHAAQSSDSSSHSASNLDSSAHPHAEYQTSTLLRYLEHNGADSPTINRSRKWRAAAKSPASQGRHPFDHTYLPLIGSVD